MDGDPGIYLITGSLEGRKHIHGISHRVEVEGLEVSAIII